MMMCERRILRVQVKQTSSSKVQVCRLNVHLPHRELQGQLLSSGTEKGTDSLPVSDHMERCFITLAESLKWIFHLFSFLDKTMINSGDGRGRTQNYTEERKYNYIC